MGRGMSDIFNHYADAWEAWDAGQGNYSDGLTKEQHGEIYLNCVSEEWRNLILNKYKELKMMQQKRRYKEGWVYYQLKEFAESLYKNSDDYGKKLNYGEGAYIASYCCNRMEVEE
jgi:hypothetical protein